MFLRITVLMFVKIEIDNFSFYLPHAEVFRDGYANITYILDQYGRRKHDVSVANTKKEANRRRRANLKKIGGAPIKLD